MSISSILPHVFADMIHDITKTECGTKYVCNSDFFRVRIMRYPAFVWIYGCSQIPEGSPFAHEDSPFFEGKDDRWCVQPYLYLNIIVVVL